MYWEDENVELLGGYIDIDTLSDISQEGYKHKLRYDAEYVKSIRVFIEQLYAPTLSEVVKFPYKKYL